MRTNIQNKIKNTKLAATKPLLPLYEAAFNSFQSIEEAENREGKIRIIVKRYGLLQTDSDRGLNDIVGFEVWDNGVGFNERNFESFQTSDSDYKLSKGGKGVGRFLWLVAFAHVDIESVFKDGDSSKKRSFRFEPVDTGISDLRIEETEENAQTVVKLHGLKQVYQEHCPKKLDTIGAHIIEHCLDSFRQMDCPEVFLEEEDGSEKLLLNDIFDNQMVANTESRNVEIGSFKFSVQHVRLYSAHIKEHQVHYCANSRVVKSCNLSGKIPNLGKELLDDEQKSFVYAAYVDGDLLDNTVNAERTDFVITGAGELSLAGADWDKIRKGINSECAVHLAPFTEPVKKEKENRIERFVATEGVNYRPILKYGKDRLDKIDPAASDDDLDIALYAVYHDVVKELRTEAQRLLTVNDEEEQTSAEYEKRLEDYIEKVSDIRASDLARYVCQRRTTLEFLSRQLGLQKSGKHNKEEVIHNIIFPMGKTSDDVPLDEHNLWLVDEKLVFHSYLASDKPLRSLDPLESDSSKEPDIIVFDNACAFTNEELPISHMTLIEFKRPMRKDYSDSENPFSQLTKYIRHIRASKATTDNGRPIPVPDNIPFFCYVICDITPKLDEFASNFNLLKTADGMGYFGFNQPNNAYFEVMSYDKMIQDAKKRNAIFFEKLGLPSKLQN
jgi:hypothetical protein